MFSFLSGVQALFLCLLLFQFVFVRLPIGQCEPRHLLSKLTLLYYLQKNLRSTAGRGVRGLSNTRVVLTDTDVRIEERRAAVRGAIATASAFCSKHRTRFGARKKRGHADEERFGVN